MATLTASLQESGSAGFADALFTATSATCVTGLIVQDTFSFWTPFGQAVILCLIQTGGLFFCCVGFFNGIGLTRFVMVQGILGAFFVRVPVSYLMSKRRPVSLFRIGLATPASSLVQTILCFVCLYLVCRKWKKEGKL